LTPKNDFKKTLVSSQNRQNGEICLQKYLPITGNNISITNRLKQNAIDYQIHLTIENNLKVEQKVIITKTSTTLPPQKKNADDTYA